MKRLLLVAVILAAVAVVVIIAVRALRHDSGDLSVDQKAAPAIVVVDPAHGGSDPGTKGDSVLEKDVTLAIANKMSALASEFSGLKVVLTRSSDTDVTASNRIGAAAREGAAVYVAIHANAFNSPTAVGIETLVDAGHVSGDAAWSLALAMEKATVASTSAKERGVRAQGASFAGLTVPAAAVYVGFITAPDERAKLTTAAYQELLARGILQGISDYLATASGLPGSSASP
jgi:N-acetylmuramoyl-L-alanine amidase